MNRTLYVRHLGQTMNLSAIEDLFTTVGDVETSEFVTTADLIGAPKIGIIKMATVQQALDCIERFNGHSMNGHALSVAIKRPEAHRAPTKSRSK